MNLQRVYAYAVHPSRLSEDTEVSGGRLETTRELREALDEAARPLQDEGMPIAFVVDTTTRTNEVRELCRQMSFEPSAKALSASNQLATRLGAAMDQRSDPCLFVLALYVGSQHLWTPVSQKHSPRGARDVAGLITSPFAVQFAGRA